MVSHQTEGIFVFPNIYPSYSGPDLIESRLEGFILKKSGVNLSFWSITSVETVILL